MLPTTTQQLTSKKLQYLIIAKNICKLGGDACDDHKYAVINHYLNQIKDLIEETFDEITNVYDIVREHETFEREHVDSDDDAEAKTFVNLYHTICEDNTNDTDFIRTFSPYMALWNVFQDGQ